MVTHNALRHGLAFKRQLGYCDKWCLEGPRTRGVWSLWYVKPPKLRCTLTDISPPSQYSEFRPAQNPHVKRRSAFCTSLWPFIKCNHKAVNAGELNHLLPPGAEQMICCNFYDIENSKDSFPNEVLVVQQSSHPFGRNRICDLQLHQMEFLYCTNFWCNISGRAVFPCCISEWDNTAEILW